MISTGHLPSTLSLSLITSEVYRIMQVHELYGKSQSWLATSRFQILWINLLLFFTILLAYWQVGSHEFVNLDTPAYVTKNPYVNSGLTPENITWAFTTTYEGNWHPLTWLSHMLDVQLFGLAPGPHHMVNLSLHIINSLLLFYLFRRLTKTLWPSALVAALFALHPLRVESVAWVAERKDLLSGFFWMLTLISYCRYVEQPRVQRYLAVLLFLGLGLMAKSMLVTLPFVMLLLDYWPLGRFEVKRVGQSWAFFPSPGRLISEKAPLFLLSLISSAITLYAQNKVGAVGSIKNIPILDRVANSLVSYVSYLVKTIWPANLAVFYPLKVLPVWQVLGAPLLLFAICYLVLKCSKSRPWLMVGWLWYLGTLVPVIGLVQVGSQAMADRYTYLPLIGISIIIAWGLAELIATRLRLKPLIIAIMVVVLVVLTIATKVQVGHWRNSLSLYEHALAATTDNAVAHFNLGIYLSDLDKLTEADPHFAEALRLKPSSMLYNANYGFNLDRQGMTAEAEKYYQRALLLDTKNEYAPELHFYMGLIKSKRGSFEEAATDFKEALRIDPKNIPALFFMGNVMLAQGKSEEAFNYYSETVRINPQHAFAYCGLGDVKISQGKPKEAIPYFSEALRLAPEDPYVRSRVEYLRKNLEADCLIQ